MRRLQESTPNMGRALSVRANGKADLSYAEANRGSEKKCPLSLPESSEVKNRELTLTLPSYGLVVIEVK